MSSKFDKEIKFAHDLSIGRIAEVIFEQMIRLEGKYEVIPFGYERTLPAVAQYQDLVKFKDVIDDIKKAPDFILISNDKSKVYQVEVKYRSSLDLKKIKDEAEILMKRWKSSYLFIATPDGFYNGKCQSIAAGYNISKLSEKWVADDRQKEYLKLLRNLACFKS